MALPLNIIVHKLVNSENTLILGQKVDLLNKNEPEGGKDGYGYHRETETDI